MKTAHIKRLLGAGLLTIFLLAGSTALADMEISGDALQSLIDSGETLTVPEGETYTVILPDGKEVKLLAGTIFTVTDEDGKVRVIRRRDNDAPRPPYERMKEFPRKIVEENLNDVSPS